jgi:hypothetical protein
MLVFSWIVPEWGMQTTHSLPRRFPVSLRPFTPRSRCAWQTKAGCTVVELLVAIMVFAVGALSLAGSSAVVLRQLHSAHTRSTAASVVSSRIALIASAPCGNNSNGVVSHSGLSESWSAEPSGPSAVLARVQVTFLRGGQSQHFESIASCR